mgnify:CR=1 FL=1
MVTHTMKAAERGNRVLYLADGVVKDEIELTGTEGESRHRKLKEFLNDMGW